MTDSFDEKMWNEAQAYAKREWDDDVYHQTHEAFCDGVRWSRKQTLDEINAFLVRDAFDKLLDEMKAEIDQLEREYLRLRSLLTKKEK